MPRPSKIVDTRPVGIRERIAFLDWWKSYAYDDSPGREVNAWAAWQARALPRHESADTEGAAMTDEQIIAIFKANGVLRIPARSISDPDGLGFMVAIGRELFRAGMERAAVIAEDTIEAEYEGVDRYGENCAAAIRAEAAKNEPPRQE